MVQAKCRFGPSHDRLKSQAPGRVSGEGQYAIHKTLLGRSSWSVIPELTA
jgi:hypothetical protein